MISIDHLDICNPFITVYSQQPFENALSRLTLSRLPFTVWVKMKVTNMALKGLHYLTSLYSIISHGFNDLLLHNKAPKTLVAEIT